MDAGNMQVGEMIAFITYTMQIVMSFLMLAMVAVMPVSYTHLDVYKRQQQGIPGLSLLHRMEHSGIDKHALPGLQNQPGFAHVDVYKRQV